MTTEQSGETCLKTRRITLKDGRYMIFYTFDHQAEATAECAEPNYPEANPEPQAENERGV